MRFKENMGSLDVWFGEFVASYLAGANIEIVPDIRISRKYKNVEFRPGFGVIFKTIKGKFQIVNQVKWQFDYGTNNEYDQTLRYVFFLNYVPNPKLVLTAIAGTFAEIGPNFSGWMGVRAGVGAAYIFDKQHSINFGYYYGLFNSKDGFFTNLGIINFQLIINLTKDYKYLPAKYYMF